MVLCSSRDGVPLKLKKEHGRPGSFKIPIDWYHFRPLLAADGQYLSNVAQNNSILHFFTFTSTMMQ